MNRHHPQRPMLLPAALCMALALSSCTGLPAPAPTETGTRDASQASTPPASTAPVSPAPSIPVSESPVPAPDGGSTAVALSTFSGTWEDVRYSFDHPSDWTVQDTTVGGSPGSGVVTVMGPDGRELASLTILVAWGAECPCVERPAVHLGDVAGDVPLSKSGPFVVRSMAMDLTKFPQDRAENQWADNVQVVTSLSSATGPAATALVPRLMYGLGLVETGVVATNGVTHRTVLFISSRDFGTMAEAHTYGASEEHRTVQELIASFREGSARA
ncbi:hypothetical protein [Pseudarthrobacter sulfonivorans]|uniref:hypothetical protein n=1 Tax=Pseudarthrobacter sulfonivorans TaxID=121292 RepID=UPI0028608B20|nr:hypothetical protein [Pseudarthrobacter sulfonivorans]MDR6413330.1 hypothetical protein [Pseudarthrobacter sulfonivorans]